MPSNIKKINVKLFESIVQNHPQSTLILDDHRRVLYANKRVLTHFGYNRQAMPAKSFETLIAPDHREQACKIVDDFIRSNSREIRINDSIDDLRCTRIDSSEFSAEIHLIKIKNGDGDHVAAVFYDTTRLNKLENYLQNVISIDPITKLLNRRAFEERLGREHERELRRDRTYGIFLMDIRGLRHINEEYGHDTGDKAIRIYSDYCRNFFRKSDMIAKWGDDEFIAFLPEVSEKSAKTISKRLISAVKGIKFKCPAGERDVEIAVNIGICLSSPVNSFQAVILQATEAMKKSKKQGPNKIVMEAFGGKSCNKGE